MYSNLFFIVYFLQQLGFNPLGSNSDQRQIFLGNINTFSWISQRSYENKGYDHPT